MKKLVKPILDTCNKEKISIPAAYINFQLSDISVDDDLSDTLIHLGELAAKIAAEMDCKYLIVSPLSVGIAGADAWRDHRLCGLQRLYPLVCPGDRGLFDIPHVFMAFGYAVFK